MNYDTDTCRECGVDLEGNRQRAKGLCGTCGDGVIQK